MATRRKKRPARAAPRKAPTYRKRDALGRWRTLDGHYTAAPRKGSKWVDASGRWRGPYPSGAFASPPRGAPKPSRPAPAKPRGRKRRFGPKPAPLPPPRAVSKDELKVLKKRGRKRKLPPVERPRGPDRIVPETSRPLSPKEWVEKWRPYLERVRDHLLSDADTASRLLRHVAYNNLAEVELEIQVPGGTDGLVAQDALHFDGWLTGVEEVVMERLPRGEGWAQLVLRFVNIAPVDEEDPSPMMRSEEPFDVSTIPQDLRGYIAKIWDAARAIQETSSCAQEERVGWVTHAVELVFLRLSYGPKPVW